MKASMIIICLSAMLLSACSSSPKEKQLLPDSGLTTAEIIAGGQSGGDYYGTGIKADYLGTPLVSAYAPNSSYSLAHVNELRRDFHQVPNPEIVGYVYPHIVNNQLPVPGYFTVFRLYNRDHYALATEGYHHE